MYRLLAISFLLACQTISVLTAFSQSLKDKEIVRIRQIFQTINKDSNYQLTKIDEAEEILGHATDGGASLTGYFKGDTLHKVIEWVGLSNRVVQNEYYLDKGRLIFVYSAEQHYAYNDSLQALDYTKFVPAFYGRYYFKNNQLFEAVLSDKKRKQSEKDDAAGFLKRLTAYSGLLQKKRK